MRRAALVVALATAAGTTHAGPPVATPAEPAVWQPDRFFVQGGLARGVRTAVVGATGHGRWRRRLWGGELASYWEASLGRWSAQPDNTAPPGTAWVTQLGVTPVLRWHAVRGGGNGARDWFVEAGIGANLLLPIYRSRDKRFSTAFNFGDHVGIGWPLGGSGSHELVLRLQHFSNAGIRHPNPGEDFVQLRYAWRG